MTTSKRYAGVLELGNLGPLDDPLSKDDGESLEVVPLHRDPGVLFKRYRPELCGPDDSDRLDRLILLPQRISPQDAARLLESSCWPMSRVVHLGTTVGVLIPRAPRKFGAALTSLTGVGKVKPLAIDWLAMSSGQQTSRGLPGTTFAQRLQVCQDIASVAAVLEREAIVYADWSYANALWSPTEFRGYLIDVDGCAFGRRPWVKTLNWEDPLTPESVPVDNYTDRFRLALLVMRCVTGERDVGVALEAVLRLSTAEGLPDLGRTLERVVNAGRRAERPSVVAICDAMTPGGAGASPGNVIGWKFVGRPPAPSTGPVRPTPAPTAPRPRPVPPRATTPPAGKKPAGPKPAGTRPTHPRSTPRAHSRPATPPKASDSLPDWFVALGGLVVIALLIWGVVSLIAAIF